MRKPQGITLSRKKGFNLQKFSRKLNGLAAVNVARPSSYGNPFTLAQARRLHPKETELQLRHRVVRAYACLIDGEIVQKLRKELRGKNLACWCRKDQPCHRDVLLAIVNR